MFQTESGSIRQLRKGCSFKDRPVMLLLSMLVLAMVIQVIFACHCEEINWERVMCPEENKTVVMAIAKSEHRAATPSGSLETTVTKVMKEIIFKEGPNNLTMIEHFTFLMFSPRNCSATFGDENSYYILYGETDVGGILHGSNCTMELYGENFFSKSGRGNLYDILRGRQDPKC